MSGQRALPQSKEALLKSYQTRLKDDVKSILENFEGKLFAFIYPCFLNYLRIKRKLQVFVRSSYSCINCCTPSHNPAPVKAQHSWTVQGC